MHAFTDKEYQLTLILTTSNPYSAHSSILSYTFENAKLSPVKQDLPIPSSEAHGCSIRSRLSSSIGPSHSSRILAVSLGSNTPIQIINLDKNISKPQSISSTDFSLVMRAEAFMLVTIQDEGVELYELNADCENTRRLLVRQDKGIELNGVHCADAFDDKFKCVFKASGAYIVEMVFNWNNLSSTVYYHLVDENYTAITTRVESEFIVAEVV